MLGTLSHPRVKRVGFFILIAFISAGMASSLSKYGGPMLRAASSLSLWLLSLAFLLSLVYRLINATGWGLVLRALGQPVRQIASARIWLASEACRWLPGSLWSFGSRAVLASRRGVSGPVVTSSLVLELVVTVLAWGVIALSGWWSLRLPTGWGIHNPLSALPWVIGAVIVLVFGYGLSRTPRIRFRLAGKLGSLRVVQRKGIDRSELVKSFFFFVAMGLFNGAILNVIVRALPEGSTCPLWAIITANAVAWLAGFFAIFAPGGLIVREACLASLLAPWLSPSDAIAIALAWRLIQILAEILCFALIAAVGLPNELLRAPESHSEGSRLPTTGTI